MRRPPAEGTEMVRGVVRPPGLGGCGGGLAQPGEGWERPRAGERRRVRMSRKLRGLIAVSG